MELAPKVKGESLSVTGMLGTVDSDHDALKHRPWSPQNCRYHAQRVLLKRAKLSQVKGTRTAQLVNELEELAQRCGIEVRHEKLLREIGYRARSGSCKVREKNLVILDRTLAPSDQVEVLADALRGQDLENQYLSPAARRLLQEERG
jgi:hypothetical protein